MKTQPKRILLALSGGVDSAVAALLLKKQGHQVICAFMKNFSDTKNKLTSECRWVEDYAMAKKVAAHLELPLIKLDFENQYRKRILEPMFKQYSQGLTPNPDIACNTIIKFPLLWKEAIKLKADYIATGHYARIKKTLRGYELLLAEDKSKDQSYFLSELSQKDLSHVIFPIGNLTKKEVREMAEKNHLPNYNRPSTAGICFVGNIPMKSFLENKISKKKGAVLDEYGKNIGTHNGASYYTLGERARPSEGMEIKKGNQSQKRFYISEKNMKLNTITIVPENHPSLLKKSFHIKKIHWVNPINKSRTIKARVRIRHLGPLVECTLRNKNYKIIIDLKRPIPLPSPGQKAVFYKGSQVIASGDISPR